MKNQRLAQLFNVDKDSLVDEQIALELAKKWHSEFLPDHTDWVCKKPRGSFRWEFVKCVSEKKDAQRDYDNHFARTYFIMPEAFGKNSLVMYRSETKPEINAFEALIDCYVFPKNMAWTMAFSHESGWLGPYFSKHRNYEKLQKKNIESLNAKSYFFSQERLTRRAARTLVPRGAYDKR